MRGAAPKGTRETDPGLAALGAKLKTKIYYPGSGPESAPFIAVVRKMTIRTLPREPRGRGVPRNTSKIVLSAARPVIVDVGGPHCLLPL